MGDSLFYDYAISLAIYFHILLHVFIAQEVVPVAAAPAARPLEELRLLSYYAVLGVPPACTVAVARAKWGEVGPGLHPDNGGCADTYAFKAFVANVLTKSALRAKYDQLGSNAFEALHAPPTITPPIVEVAYTITTQKVNNCVLLRSCCSFVAMRQCHLPGGLVSYAAVLEHFAVAASASGFVKVLWCGEESSVAALADEKAWAQVVKAEFPSKCQYAAPYLLGLSVYALPKSLQALLNENGTWRDFLALASIEHPGVDWTLESHHKWIHITNAVTGIERRLREDAPLNVHTDFSLLCAAAWEGLAVINGPELHRFMNGLWTVTPNNRHGSTPIAIVYN